VVSPETGLLLAGAVAAGFVQGVAGFAFGMVAMSFWVWSLEPQVAAVMVVFGSLAGQLVAVFSVRRGFNGARLGPFLAGGALGIPLGIWALPMLEPAAFKLAIGTALGMGCPAMLWAERWPRVQAGRLADTCVGAVGGAMTAVGGFGGLVPSLWCTLRRMDKDEQRSVMQNFNLAALSVTAGGYLLAGVVTAPMVPQLAVVIPALILPALLGARVYAGLSPLQFRRVVLSLLSLAGATMAASALLTGWSPSGGHA
jgi:uncharacterized membrane protein YfcA